MEAKDWIEKIPEDYRKYAREYAHMKCEEQKKMCLKEWEKQDVDHKDVAIKNAPEPTYE